MNKSIDFFDAQFRDQVSAGELALNPFETIALPHLRGRLLDFGCGLGNLAVAAARQGCSVLALDASPTAIAHLRRLAAADALDIEAIEADLASYALTEDFDSMVSIGLLMFLDCAAAHARLAMLKSRLRPGGTAVINLLVAGTTYLDMFDGAGYCLFGRDELQASFDGWTVLDEEFSDFAAPGGTTKAFVTLTARKPG